MWLAAALSFVSLEPKRREGRSSDEIQVQLGSCGLEERFRSPHVVFAALPCENCHKSNVILM